MPHFSSAIAKGSSAFSSLTGCTSLAPPANVVAAGAVPKVAPVVGTDAAFVCAFDDKSKPDSIVAVLVCAGASIIACNASKSSLPNFVSVFEEATASNPSRSAPADGFCGTLSISSNAGASLTPRRSVDAASGFFFFSSAPPPPRSSRSAGGAVLSVLFGAVEDPLATQGPTLTPSVGAGTSRPNILFFIHDSLYQVAAGVL
mmetsp:Transcript_48717/g.109379  ORF Transcript_48717/g.109379 Transcript_48717/m.109379 type:complete len:202 (+) Transcript_48717:125-730(+)